MQKPPSPIRDGLRPLCKHGFRYCFTPYRGAFSSFSRLTGSLSVVEEYLGGVDPHVQSEFHELEPTLASPATTLRDYHPLWSVFPDDSR